MSDDENSVEPEESNDLERAGEKERADIPTQLIGGVLKCKAADLLDSAENRVRRDKVSSQKAFQPKYEQCGRSEWRRGW